MSDKTEKARGGYNFNKAPGIMVNPEYNPGLRSDNQSVVKTGSTNGEGSTNGKTTVTKPSGQVVKNNTTPDPAKLASQANTSMSGSNVEFGQGVKNLAKRIDRNQAGRRSMKQETTRRIQEGDFTHGYAKLPSDVKKDNGTLLGKYDRKMLKASNKQKNRLNKAAAKLGLQVTNSTKNNVSPEKVIETASNGNAVVNGKILNANGDTKNVNKPGNLGGNNPLGIGSHTPSTGNMKPSGDNSKINSNIKVTPGHAGGSPGIEDLNKVENEANNEFLKHEGKHLKVGEDYIPGRREYHKYSLVNDPNKFAIANIKPMSFDDFGGKNSNAQSKFDNLTSFISKNPSNTEAKNLLKTQKERFLVNEPGSGIKIKKG